MIHTQVCDVLGIEHPVVLGGMAGGHTSAPLVATVSNAGALGTLGVSGLPADRVTAGIDAIRAGTQRAFAVNFLLFMVQDAAFEAALAARPPVVAFSWAAPGQDLARYVSQAKAAGCKVIYQAGTVPEARWAHEAGADVIVAQGTEAGGHTGWMATLALVPMVVDAVAPTPVVAAGGIADGRGLAAALALGAQGALLGTRFLATEESPLHPNFKQAILDSDGHDTELTDVLDVARARVWPGAMVRLRRNAFVSRWAGRDWALRAAQAEAFAALQQAARDGDVDEAALMFGQDAGLVADLPTVGDVVSRIVGEAEALIAKGLPGLLRT